MFWSNILNLFSVRLPLAWDAILLQQKITSCGHERYFISSAPNWEKSRNFGKGRVQNWSQFCKEGREAEKLICALKDFFPALKGGGGDPPLKLPLPKASQGPSCVLPECRGLYWLVHNLNYMYNKTAYIFNPVTQIKVVA